MNGKREGKTQYNQVILESGTSSESSNGSSSRAGKDTTTGTKKDSQNSESSVARKSTERANVGFTISFKVPITGRYPTNLNTTC